MRDHPFEPLYLHLPVPVRPPEPPPKDVDGRDIVIDYGDDDDDENNRRVIIIDI